MVKSEVAERAHPSLDGFQKNQKYRKFLFDRYAWANSYCYKSTVLDIPTGIGWGASRLYNAKLVYGIDISPSAIFDGKSRYNNIILCIGNMTAIPLADNSIDVTICLDGYEHIFLEDQYKFLDEVYRVTKDDGLFIVNVPLINEDKEKGSNPYHLHEPSAEELCDMLIRNFYFVVYGIDQINGLPCVRSVCKLRNKK